MSLIGTKMNRRDKIIDDLENGKDG